MKKYLNKIICGEALSTLKTLPEESVDCIVTSPPYWALRDYGVEGQLGLETTFQEYITKLCDIFDEVKRVLKNTGTCWVNMGDTYISKGESRHAGYTDPKYTNGRIGRMSEANALPQSIPEKCLAQIPSRFAIEMTNRGWILRNEIIWYKPNCMPSSVKDRFTVDFEKVFFFVKNKKYWFEQQLDEYTEPINRWGGNMVKRLNGADEYGMKQRIRNYRPVVEGKNKRCVWKVTTKPFKEAHFATYPPDLIEPMILAGCPKEVCIKCGKPRERILERIGDSADGGKMYDDNRPDGMIMRSAGFHQKVESKEIGYTDCGCNVGFKCGIVLDPFFGSGTTGLVAKKQNKHYIGIELNPEYIKIANKRIQPTLI
jgi:DNA modification methylase